MYFAQDSIKIQKFWTSLCGKNRKLNKIDQPVTSLLVTGQSKIRTGIGSISALELIFLGH
jgi:hypothetical protein